MINRNGAKISSNHHNSGYTDEVPDLNKLLALPDDKKVDKLSNDEALGLFLEYNDVAKLPARSNFTYIDSKTSLEALVDEIVKTTERCTQGKISP